MMYLCFSIIMGGCLLALIPADKKPSIKLPQKWLSISTAFIPVFAAAPVIYLAADINKYRDESFWISLLHILFTAETGRAWTALLFLCLCFLGLIGIMSRTASFPIVYAAGIFLIFGMITTQGVTGHAVSMGSYPGAAAHIFHFMAVSAWLGVLFVVSWYSTDDNYWKEFTGWFTPIAVGCVTVVIFSGMLMASFLTEDLTNSWLLTYGQTLLLKHLLFIPLLTYACINGFLLRRKINSHKNYSPRIWWRAESLIAVVIFVVTAFMSEQEPPHNIQQTLASQEPTPIFQSLLSFEVSPETNVTFSPDVVSILFLVSGLLYIMIIVIGFQKKLSAPITLLLSLLTVLSLYFGVMNSLEDTSASMSYLFQED
ncbi:copper resistance D family protein [Alteribacillus sp. HJP-4]|uniref:copper resistance D family protein n=1 Tax=Alteribacillus sp. HJP-4 TaxID=2775394 RepID=UPI0035CCCCB4